MCGIAGIISENPERCRPQMEKMLEVLDHRGPDASGIQLFDGAILGHTRLSIIDLESGDQPMLSADENLGIVFNGEIYGYKDIKQQLFKGETFRTSSDTEVLLKLYSKYEKDLFNHLPGMFSFAIWDQARHSLFCARDRFGEKPFYFAYGPAGEFIFASEVKAILATGLVNSDIDDRALRHYMRRLYVAPNQCIFKDIFVLPPAHQLTWHKEEVKVNRYWDLPDENKSISFKDAKERLVDLFDRSVSQMLVADVPVGIFLSGGIDSSTVVAEAAKSGKKLRTFSFGFEDKSELPYAKAVANKYDTEHVVLGEAELQVEDLLIKMQEVFDEPFADSSNIPTYIISKLAREHLKVVLGGDGADELFGGYDFWYNKFLSMEKAAKFHTAGKFTKVYQRLIRKMVNASFNSELDQGLHQLDVHGSIAKAHYNQYVYFSDKMLDNIGLNGINHGEFLSERYTTNSLNDAMNYDMESYLPGDILVKVDRASMANSLEIRSPFLDWKLAEFALSLPSQFKINDQENKHILRAAFKNRWPEKVSSRQKQGFGSPIMKWMKQKEVHSLMMEIIANPSSKLYNYLDFKETRKYVEQLSIQTWVLFILGLWMEKRL